MNTPETWFTEDKNSNGMVCVKFLANGNEIVKDDSAATRSQPCPPAFNVIGTLNRATKKIPLDDLIADDGNQNGTACLKTWDTTNNFIVRDDNPATPSQPCPPAFIALAYSGAAPADPGEPAPAEPAR